MTITGFLKVFDADKFMVIKTTGSLEVWKDRLKEVIEIDEVNELFIFRDIYGSIGVIDINDICAVTLRADATINTGSGGSEEQVSITYDDGTESIATKGIAMSYDSPTESLSITSSHSKYEDIADSDDGKIVLFK